MKSLIKSLKTRYILPHKVTELSNYPSTYFTGFKINHLEKSGTDDLIEFKKLRMDMEEVLRKHDPSVS